MQYSSSNRHPAYVRAGKEDMLLPPKWALFTSIALRPVTTRKCKL